MGGCWSWVNCRDEDEDEEGAQTGHPRNPAHVAPCPGGPRLHHFLGDPQGEEPNEATLVPGSLPGLHVPTDILEEELNEETSVPGSLPEPHIPTDILEQEFNEEMSVPRSLPGPCITNDILGEEPNEATLVPGSLPILCVPTDILGKEVNEETSKPGPLPGPHITNGILGEELNEETSVPGSLSGTLISTDIFEETLKEETSMPGSLLGPHITNDILGEEVNEETSVPGPSIPTGTPKEAAFVSEPLPEPSIADNYLEQRWGKEGDQALMPVIQTASHDDPAGPAACLRPPGSASLLSSASLEVGSIPPSASTSSFLLHPSPPPPPSPPPLEPDLSNVKETLQSLMGLQFHQLNDRQRDLHGCQECLQNLKALRGQLRRLRSRLARVEATMGILVPPRELDVEEEKEQDKNQTVLHTKVAIKCCIFILKILNICFHRIGFRDKTTIEHAYLLLKN
ncbi:uncharacterized protein LOC128347401 [Hemicordylus capensis]|uniref:uncharacterized protein LOC128347401 n=1 Tax=Hemicordylus capensis TaxID=884348 RepID=UPI00230410F0|nr:uncharacterized protein LOC128347401 [Hemicordylus capensis]